jgi:putative membrane protein
MFGWHGYGGGFMWIFWLFVIVAVAWFAVSVKRGRGDAPAREDSALDILQKRYARGEIDREEFEQKKRDLGE